MGDTAISFPLKSRPAYGRLVVSTGTSTQVVVYSKYRPTAVVTGNDSLASDTGSSRVLIPIQSSSAYLAGNGTGQV